MRGVEAVFEEGFSLSLLRDYLLEPLHEFAWPNEVLQGHFRVCDLDQICQVAAWLGQLGDVATGVDCREASTAFFMSSASKWCP